MSGTTSASFWPSRLAKARRQRRRNRSADFLGKLSAGAPVAGLDQARNLAGVAGRRGRSRRRGIRSLSARTALRFSGDDPGIRHGFGALHSARRADFERHARTLGRAAPPLPLSLPRFSRRRPRGGDHPDAPARISMQASRCRSRAWSGMLRKEELRKVPGVAETLDWAATLAGLGVEDMRQEPELVTIR